MEHRSVYEEYKAEHPEEMVNINRLYQTSRNIEKSLENRRSAKLKKIEECRRLLYGTKHPE